MKRLIKLAAISICFMLFISYFSFPAHADGEGNMNGGGGGMGGGTAQNVWHNGDDGIRVTVVRASDNQPVSTPFDMTNRNESDIQNTFVKKSKLSYRGGATLALDTNRYSYVNPSKALPVVITGNSSNNIPAIKNYFTDELVIRYIASVVGTSYDTLTNGNYKLLLEPIAYFTFSGATWAMTATEAAKYDQMASGGLRKQDGFPLTSEPPSVNVSGA